MLNFDPAQPMDPDDVTSHVQSDPQLRDQMYRLGLIWFFGGKYLLTAKGKAVMAERARARAEAVRMGLVDPASGGVHE